MLQQNPSLLYLDISNKVSPKVDVSVVHTLAHSCQFLRVLKLSDFRVEDPQCLLALCGKVILPVVTKEPQKVAQIATRGQCSGGLDDKVPEMKKSSKKEQQRGVSECVSGNAVVPDISQLSRLQDLLKSNSTADSFSHNSIAFLHNRLSAQFPNQTSSCVLSGSDNVPTAASGCSNENRSPMDQQDVSTLMEQLLCMKSSTDTSAMDWMGTIHEKNEDISLLVDRGLVDACPVGQNNYVYDNMEGSRGACLASARCEKSAPNIQDFPTREEHENQLARRERDDVDCNHAQSDSSTESAKEGDSDEDLYENDDPVVLPLNVEDHSSEFGCLELETLWLDNVNLNDQVCAILLQSLPNLRDLNLSDTDICNPWRLLDTARSSHLRLLQNLDVKSTALSRTALEMIPKFHPDLHKFSISSTTLPPHTYANIGKLTGVANLELIGGQFYPCEPEEIFTKGIAPAVHAIGIHLHSLNLTYIAHINFEVIAMNCPVIEHLDVSSTLIAVAYPCVSLGNCCPRLVSLNLGSSHINAKEGEGDNAHPVSAEKALEMMLGQPRALEELDLSGLTVTDETLKSIFPVPLHPLCVINLSRCNKVSIAGVQHIWEQCPHLKSIDITHCREITLADFQNFEKSCHHSRPIFKQEGRLNWV